MVKSITRFLSLVFLVFSLLPLKANALTSVEEQLLNTVLWTSAISMYVACKEDKTPCSTNWINDADTDHDFAGADLGHDGNLKGVRLFYGFPWKDYIYQSDSWRLEGGLEFSLLPWYIEDDEVEVSSGQIVGASATFRYRFNSKSSPYAEVGIGPNLTSSTTIGDDKISINLQFGDILGFGYAFEQFDVGYRYIHYSNSQLALPNPGVDFHNVHLSYRFD